MPEIVTTVETHTSGEPFRIITQGLPKNLPGKTLLEKRRYIEENYDYLRTSLINEPRGHFDMFGGFYLEPFSKEADFAMIFCHGTGYTDQCGHGMIAVVSASIALGWIPKERIKMKPELTEVRIETTVGIIETVAMWNGKHVEFVRFKNTPVFILEENITINTKDYGELTGDVVFNGAMNFFVDLPAEKLQVSPENAGFLIELGSEIKQNVIALNKDLTNKDFPQINKLHGVFLSNKIEKSDLEDEDQPNRKSVFVFGSKQIDRSPCGSSTAGITGRLFLQNKISSSYKFVNESIIGSRFRGKIVKEGLRAYAGERDACVVEVEGSARIIGMSTWWLDDEDDIAKGFTLSR